MKFWTRLKVRQYYIPILSILYLYYIQILIFAVIKKYSNNYKIINWCQHKQYIYIASGINPHCSKMDSNIFSTIVKNTNAIKYSYFRANNLRHQLSLLAAILILIYFFISIIQYYNNSLSGQRINIFNLEAWKAYYQYRILYTSQTTSVAE